VTGQLGLTALNSGQSCTCGLPTARHTTAADHIFRVEHAVL